MNRTFISIAAAIGFLVVPFASMAGPKDQWWTISASYPRTLAPQYMVDGGLENGRQLFVCRAAIGNRVFPGKTWDGLSGCFVAIGGEPLATSYQVLAKPPIVSDYFVYRLGHAHRDDRRSQPVVSRDSGRFR